MINATFNHQMVFQGMSMGNPTTICQGADMLRGQKLSSYYSIEPL
jgi:hypothetical protein